MSRKSFRKQELLSHKWREEALCREHWICCAWEFVEFRAKRKYFLGSTPPPYCSKNKKKSAYTADQNRPKGERKSGRKDFGSAILLINVKSRARKFPMRVLSKRGLEAQKEPFIRPLIISKRKVKIMSENWHFPLQTITPHPAHLKKENTPRQIAIASGCL